MARVDLREIAERLAVAGDVTAVGNVLADACEQALPHGSFGYAVFEPTVCEHPCMVVRSGEFAPEWLLKRFPEILQAMERDLGGVAAAISERKAYDGFQKFPLETLRNTELLNDHWRPIRCDQQLVAPVWHGGAPVGYFTVLRSSDEASFTSSDLRFMEELRLLAEKAIEGIATLGAEGLTLTLDALAQVFPYPAFLFGAGGQLRWMSDDGAVRLGVAGFKVGASRVIRSCSALAGLSRIARTIENDPGAVAAIPLRSEGILRANERLVVRRFGQNGKSLFLLALTPGMANLPGEAGGTPDAALPRLGAVESKVARLAAEGYTVTNMAARLGVTEATVRTHLHRIYVKLGVHGRAELSFALFRGQA